MELVIRQFKNNQLLTFPTNIDRLSASIFASNEIALLAKKKTNVNSRVSALEKIHVQLSLWY